MFLLNMINPCIVRDLERGRVRKRKERKRERTHTHSSINVCFVCTCSSTYNTSTHIQIYIYIVDDENDRQTKKNTVRFYRNNRTKKFYFIYIIADDSIEQCSTAEEKEEDWGVCEL